MKKLVKTSFILLVLVGVLFTSCRKEYAVPPIEPVPFGDTLSIGDILAMTPKTTFDTSSVCGIVTADEQSGNLYKTIFIQDRVSGKGIELLLNTSSAARIGDSVRVCLDPGIMYNPYHNLPQLTDCNGKGFSPDGHLLIYPYNKPIEPKTVTIADIKSGEYTATLVKLDSVEFLEKNVPFCEVGETTNRHLVDETNPNSDDNFVVRTSSYANFAYDYMPISKGSLVAIASVYNSTYQLIIRSKSEMKFAVWGNPDNPEGDASLPYYQDFASSFGTYTTYDVAGAQSWEIDYSTAKMTGFVNSTNYANEDWLISKQVSLEGVTNVSMTMSYIARYFNNLDSDITVQVSTNYTSGDPTLATWTQVPASWTSGSNWTDFASTTVDLSQFAGQKVNVAVKYVSTEDKAGTIEVQSILIQEGSGPTPPPGPNPGGEVQNLPYFQSFASEFGTYKPFDVFGDQSWEIDYSTAKMTGYINSTGVNCANEDWLVSSPVAITGVNDAKMTMVYIARYFNSINDDITIWVSTNYTWDSDPATATWTQVPASLREGSNWTDFVTSEISLTEYVGQTITLAVKYVSTDIKAGTIEIQSITIEEGSGVTPTPPTPPGPSEGSGTADDPYNVASGIALQSGQPTAWVQGYIVGAVKSGDSHNTVTSNDDIDWAAPFGRATNVLIADDPSCNEVNNCIIVKLPSGKPLRSQVNLVDHPDNLGKKLAVLGVLKNAFGQQAGLSDSNGTEADFVLEGGVTPTPPDPGTGIFSETFANGQGQFTIHNVVLPSELTYVWTHDSSRKHMKASAFKSNTPYKAESWLVSPQINLAGVSSATLSFEQAINYAEPQDRIHVMVSTNFTGEVGNAVWTELVFDQWPVNDNQWVFVTSTIDLTAYAGQQVTIAFKYTSEATQEQCPTWEVKNVVVE